MIIIINNILIIIPICLKQIINSFNYLYPLYPTNLAESPKLLKLSLYKLMNTMLRKVLRLTQK